MPTRRRAWFAICFALVLASCLALSALTQAQAQAPAGCAEWISNGGFEAGGPAGVPGWSFGAAPAMPQRVNSVVHSGQWSLLLGIPQGYPNQQSYSSARRQVSIPADATSAILTFWYDAFMPGAPTTDYVELALLDPNGRQVIDKPWRGFVDNRVWNQVSFDLTGWRGQTIVLYFNVFNDGLGSPATMFLDDVSLQVCGSASAPGTLTPTVTPIVPVTATPTVLPLATATPWTRTPTPTVIPLATATPITPSPTFTPLPLAAPVYVPPVIVASPAPAPPQRVPPLGPPAGAPLPAPAGDCVDLVRNGGFESGFAYWQTAPNKIPVRLESSAVYAGSYALQLGTFTPPAEASYSSIRQLVSIPASFRQVLLQFATWTYAAAPAGTDRMEADFLEPDPAVLDKFWRVQANDQAWVIQQVDVSNYRGRNVLLYFNVYNDATGGPAAMLLDEVHIWACQSAFAISPLPAGNVALAPGGARPGFQAPGPAATATPAPGMTVLALSSNTPEPPRGPQATAARVTPQPSRSPTPTPGPNALTRIGQALHLPPLPQYWPLGLLAILVVLFVLLLLVRSL